MPDIGGLQLLPETRRKIEIKVPGQNRSLIFAFILVSIIVALYFGLNFYKSSLFDKITAIDSKLTELETSRDKKTEQNLLALNKQLSAVGGLISNHVFWSEAFGRIQALVLPQTQFQTLTADTPGRKIIVKGVSSSYTTMARQIAALYTLEAITDIILNKVANLPTGKVEFTMQISFDPKKLLTGANSD